MIRMRWFLSLLLTAGFGLAFTAASANYVNNPGVMNGGGGSATSPGYGTFGAIGDPVVGTASSAGYQNFSTFLAPGFSIAITTPTTLSTLTTNQSPLALGGVAASDAGAITQVAWDNAGIANGAASGTGTWTASVPLTSSGANVITVTATDASANTKTDVLTVTYDPAPGTLTVTPPPSTTSASPLVVTGTGGDNLGVASVTYVNTTTGASGTATDTSGGTWATWSASVPFTPGPNTVTVYLWDQAGNVTTSTFTLDYQPSDTTAPAITFDQPSPLTATGNPEILTGTVTDASGIASLAWENTTTGTSGAAAIVGSSWSASIPLTAGPNTIDFTTVDGAGNVTTATWTVNYGAPADVTPPVATIDPAPGTVPASPITLTGTVSDGAGSGAAAVTVVNTTTGGSVTVTPTAGGTWSASVALLPGANGIQVTATDAAGNGSSVQTVTVTLNPAADTIHPVVAITAPASAATFSTVAAQVWVRGTAADDQGVAAVNWSNGATAAGGTATGTGAWGVQVSLAMGANAIQVTAIDTAGNSSTATITVMRSGPGGGGGGGGCGATGLEVLLPLALRFLLCHTRRQPRRKIR